MLYLTLSICHTHCTGFNWFKLATSTKVDADVMYQVPGMEHLTITAKIPFVFWTNSDVILSC